MKTIVNGLSRNGGGCKGLIQLYMDDALHGLYGRDKAYYRNFDYISGTSVGALSGALIVLGHSPATCIDIFDKHLPKIFDKKCLRLGLNKPKYDNKYLVELAHELLGDKRLGDCRTNFIVPAYNADKDRTKIFKSQDPDDQDFLLRDVVLASAAAPTYFAPVLINGDYYKDGGLSKNNPADILSKQARADGADVVNILSLTTGSLVGKASRAEIKGGILGASASFDDILREQDITVHENVQYDYNTVYKGKGLYLRAESIIKHSSGKIDDVSEKNIENMKLDGGLSVQANEKLLKLYYINTLK